jgi:asparagine synthase (glutamine-hydrolysing)
MCGIAGFVGPAPAGLLAAMVQSLKHRGPDDEGLHVEPEAVPPLGLGMTRLAIIDLATGRQPMIGAQGSSVVVFNGEIYNFRELRATLQARGHVFRTQSDTEVLLATYEAFGDACVEHLRGMFAFAVWDRARRRLLLARDRLGKKPLYYWRGDGLFVFASEIKALLTYPGVARRIDLAAFHHYLAFGYTPRERSIFADIAKLPPGHTAVLADGRLAVTRYWTLPTGPEASASPVSLAEAPALVRHELREAVRLRLESDVPVGVFLSGGVDSSAIVASLREVTGQRIATFSVGFGRAAPSFDERPAARLVADRFETDHHEEILEPAVAELAPAIIRHFDEPFADSSAVATFVVAQATARHVKVVLSGIGGDETFAGYPRYLGLRLSELYARLPRWLRALPAGAVLRLARESEASRSWGDWVRRFLAGSDQPLPDRYLGWTRFFGEAELSALATAALRAEWPDAVDETQRTAFAARGHDDPVDGAFRIDLATYLPDDLLVMADRMSMAHSLELRAPFCDHRLVEQSLRIAPSVKLSRYRLKGVLKTAFADVLPPEILSRRKQGFMIPLARWLRTDLRPLMEDLLSPERVRARRLFVPEAVQTLKREHLAGRRGHADRLWALMMAELWMRHYLDARGPWRLDGSVAAPRRPAAPPLRVLAVADVSPLVVLGGGVRVLWEQASRLAARGHQVRVVSRMPPGGAATATTHHGVPVRHFPADRRSLARFIRGSVLQARRAVIEEVNAHGADVLHCHQPLAALGALRSPPGRRLPSLYTFHSPAPLEYRLRQGMGVLHRTGLLGSAGAGLLWVIERSALMRATRVHVLSDFSAGLLRRLYRIDPARIVKIPGGVDTDRFRPVPDRDTARAALGLPGGRRLLLTLRNLEPRMGLDTLLVAMDRLRRQAPDVLLLVGGAGSLRGALERQVATLGLGDHVRFLGFVPEAELSRYYAVADAFVLPTRELEGFGLATIEALACGTPVLGTPIGASPEILAPLGPGLTFADAGARAMAEGIGRFLDRLARDPMGLAQLRKECRRHAEAHYGWDRAVDGIEATLRGLVGFGQAPDPEPAEACPACGTATGPGPMYRGRRYRECSHCRTAMAPARPTPAALRAFYATEYPVRFDPERTPEPRLGLFEGLLRHLATLRERGRLLDLGCGGGQLLAGAVRQGWSGLGSDVSAGACAAARKASGATVIQADSAELPLRDASVDAVTLVNVLDHLGDPARTLAEIRRVLTPAGVLALRVPNGTFHRAASRVLARLGPLGGWWGLADYPVLHLFSFTTDGLATLLGSAGFDVLEVRNSPPAAAGRADARAGWLGPGLRVLVASGARAIEILSRGRWLVAPAIELYARRPGSPGARRP